MGDRFGAQARASASGAATLTLLSATSRLTGGTGSS